MGNLTADNLGICYQSVLSPAKNTSFIRLRKGEVPRLMVTGWVQFRFKDREEPSGKEGL